MKKLIATIVTLLTLASFTGCGNYDMLDTNYTFDYAMIKIGEEWTTVKIKQWKDYEGEQVQLVLDDCSILLVSTVNCILCKGEFPD